MKEGGLIQLSRKAEETSGADVVVNFDPSPSPFSSTLKMGSEGETRFPKQRGVSLSHVYIYNYNIII